MAFHDTSSLAIVAVACLTALGLMVRPFRWPEAVWAVIAAVVLVIFGLIPWHLALSGVAKGLDVYLFLIGMMLISDIARKEGLFDWLAAVATGHAKGSPRRLFVLIYLVGIVVTVFMSNDATAVVLTPAVYAACKAAKVRDPFPYMLICAFIANAASFVLPISNPANLVIFSGGQMPALATWFSMFALPSVVSIAVTFAALYLTQRRAIAQDSIAVDIQSVPLTHGARIAGLGLIVTAIALLVASALDLDLGWPTFIAGLATLALVSVFNRENPVGYVTEISWSVLPLVAGLFVVVEALGQTGMIQALAATLNAHAAADPRATVMAAGMVTGFLANIVNNLPAGLVAGGVVQAAHASPSLSAALLIGIDLGPNLSITGSLATILWINALQREEINVGFWRFIKIGFVVMVPALLATLASVALFAG
jgi:arsenical pump membrane protein